MLIKLKNKDRLIIDEFTFKCSIGKNGINTKKREGDLCTPKGNFLITKVFYRSDKIKKINTNIKKIKIRENMGWCNDPKHKKYNSLINIRNTPNGDTTCLHRLLIFRPPCMPGSQSIIVLLADPQTGQNFNDMVKILIHS